MGGVSHGGGVLKHTARAREVGNLTFLGGSSLAGGDIRRGGDIGPGEWWPKLCRESPGIGELYLWEG